MKPLFIAGPGRSGTSALANYLNDHPEILVCRERYKRVHNEVRPALFDLSRIAREEGYERETNLPLAYHRNLVRRKDPARTGVPLKWVGDKHPAYIRSLPMLARNNPGARFIVTYRPVQEVVASYEARARNPQDGWLGGRDGISLGIQDWNRAYRRVRNFVDRHPRVSLLVVDYHDFFSRPERWAGILEAFLNVRFGEDVISVWGEKNTQFAQDGQPRLELSEEERAKIEAEADREAEAWVLGYLSGQMLHHGAVRKLRRENAEFRGARLNKLSAGLRRRLRGALPSRKDKNP